MSFKHCFADIFLKYTEYFKIPYIEEGAFVYYFNFILNLTKNQNTHTDILFSKLTYTM